MTSDSAQKLVEEGIEAIQNGDKKLGRGKLEAAVQIDTYNEQAWFWLSKVVDTIEEKRTCLGNVILINPGNKEAQTLLDKLEGVSDDKSAPVSTAITAIGGNSRQNRMLLGAMAVLLVLILCLGGLLVFSSGEEEVSVPTPFITNTPSLTPNAEQIATNEALQTPSATPTATETIQRLPPTWTFTPSPTHTPEAQSYPPPPADVVGRIIMQSGRVPGDDENQPIVVIAPASLNRQVVSGEGQRGQNPALVSGKDFFAWSQYQAGSRTYVLQIQPFGVSNNINVSSLWGANPILSDPNHPTWFENNLVFSAQQLGSLARDLWFIPVQVVSGDADVPAFGDELPPTFTPEPTLEPPPIVEDTEGEDTLESAEITEELPTATPVSPLVKLTLSDSVNTWPRFDPSGTALVFVSTNTDGQTDLRVVNINSQQIFILTENKNELTESSPDWSEDGFIIFSAKAAGGTGSDIYIMNADGGSDPTVLFDFGPEDINPRFSPDGRYIAFSSNINGNWDVFIYAIESETFYLVEGNPQSTDLVSDWTD